MFADPQVRAIGGVNPKNKKLFPLTGNSMDGPVGYDEVDSVCKGLGIPTITPTANRHRGSDRVWQIPGLSDVQINAFMENQGHDVSIDKNVYACPPALRDLQLITPILEKIRMVKTAVFRVIYFLSIK